MFVVILFVKHQCNVTMLCVEGMGLWDRVGEKKVTRFFMLVGVILSNFFFYLYNKVEKLDIKLIFW